MARALIVFGGWEKHEPEGVARLLDEQLRKNRVEVTLSNSLATLKELDLTAFDLIVPVWTLETIEPELLAPLLDAVRGGVGIAGLHGVIDSFRHEAEFHYMFGGQWVTHFDFAVRTYQVHVEGEPSAITAGLPTYTVATEQYYLLVDPANTVLATMRVGDVRMPVAWTKYYGRGRVFYCSLGHSADIVRQPETLKLVTRGLLWAANRDVV
jgi:type 1 glutamine amidotransferase